ncbi:020L [Invertebrate iridescent virus Kaz2018]|uniref:020L n=1 Tax=Invertebrate iridescent virus 6 TaxID=176652 RepID=Q91G75_IIV6|nr:020L [Invertebrate iridescent virus 6]AAK81957.1 020L [Invertebrate iridescent virus 6]QMS79696.1 hypothetical protein IIV6-T1_022 [Invertebrate iridescent virus 6]QNH08428.1 020L [Invertebrate iridescent virus Kaz2018]
MFNSVKRHKFMKSTSWTSSSRSFVFRETFFNSSKCTSNINFVI